MLKNFDLLFEQIMLGEAFKGKDMHKVVNLIKKSLERRIGSTLTQLEGVEVFHNSMGKGFGLRYIVDNSTNAVRFNFNKDNEITSVDVWGSDGGKDPQVRINTENISIARIIPFIADQLKSPKTGVYDVEITNEDFDDELETIEEILHPISEARITVDGVEYKNKKAAVEELLKQGKTKDDIIAMGVATNVLIDTVAKKLGISTKKKVSVTKGPTNEVDMSPEMKKAQAEFMKIKTTSPDELFEDLQTNINMVVKGLIPSLIITGMAGIGKTYTVTSFLEDKGLKKNDGFIHIKGAASAPGLYKILWNYRNNFIVFDDCDDVLKDVVAVNMLKGALDSDEPREVSSAKAMGYFNAIGWDNEQIEAAMKEAQENAEDKSYFVPDAKGMKVKPGWLPNQFQFTGKIIFISNLSKDKFNKAILSRSNSIDIDLDIESVLGRMKSIKKVVLPKVEMKYKDMALKILEDEKAFIDDPDDPVNIRTFQKAIKYVLAAKDEGKGEARAKELIIRYI